VASNKAARERKRRAREASAFAARPTKRRSAHARPAAALAARAAPAAARAPFLNQFTQDIARIVQRGRAEGGAAAAPARSAEDGEAASTWSPAARGRDADDPAGGGLLRSMAAEGMSDGSRARGAAGGADPAAAGDGLRAGGVRYR